MNGDRTDGGGGPGDERDFPSEAEWLDLVPPPDLVAADFVARTLEALRDPTPAQLAAFAPPTPAPDFVARTLSALQHDRRERWREMLARYVAPSASPEFVARTLLALRRDAVQRSSRRSGALRRLGRPLLLAAAAGAVVLALPRDEAPRLELRAVATMPAAFAAAHSPSLLPALFVARDQAAAPMALADSGADGVWILLQGTPAPAHPVKGRAK